MPEVLITVPTLQIASENSSEFEGTTTTAEVSDRSTNSQNESRQNAIGGNAGLQSRIKSRKSYGRRLQKKMQLRPSSSQQKASEKTLKLKSQIPRALVLTPSSSSTSLTTNESLPSPQLSIKTSLLETKRSCLVRQKSAIILAFRQRKSISQMDFNHARRQGNFPIPSTLMNHNNDNRESNALVPSTCDGNMTTAYSKNSFVHKMFNQDYYFAGPGRDPQMAGMKIFATIMLNAWRKRRDEVRRLMEEVSDLKRGAIKSKNQLHVFNTLFRVEQKRNDELNCQLKKSIDDINLTKSSYESLTTSLISLKADKALLEQQLHIKEQEFESINTLLKQTKSDLFKSMTHQRELQASLSMEQRKSQTLENQKNELINEICELNNEGVQKENNLRKELQEKSDDFSNIKIKLHDAENQLKTLNHEYKTREEHLKQEIEGLKNELKMMQTCLEETIGNRLKSCWNSSVAYQRVALQILHCLAYCVLPATPPPQIKTFPFELCFDKAMNIVKR